jgi:hypothetical protein
MRPRAQHEPLSPRELERLENAERVVPNRPATLACVAGDVRQRGAPRGLGPPASYAMPAQRLPSLYLARLAQTRPARDGQPLRERALRLRPPRFAPGGAVRQLSPETQSALRQQAQALAEGFPRSRAKVEGRNGSLSLRNPQLRGLELPRKRPCLTTIHTFCLPRADGTTAAERLFGQQPRSMFAALLDTVELPPAPRSPQRRLYSGRRYDRGRFWVYELREDLARCTQKVTGMLAN